MTAHSISVFDWLNTFRREISATIFASDGSLRIHPSAVDPIVDLLIAMYRAGANPDLQTVYLLGEQVRRRVAREFMKAGAEWGKPGRYVTLKEYDA